jgi:hypothetical protein
MRGYSLVSLTAAGLMAAALIAAGASSAGAQSRRGETAEQNVRESQQYESLLCSNPGFRARRIAQECGTVTDPELHQSCVASFECSKPASAPHWRQAPPSETIR